ncbi:putative ubiquitin protein ligase E3 component n-recognin 4, partial [Operophtera brumata]
MRPGGSEATDATDSTQRPAHALVPDKAEPYSVGPRVVKLIGGMILGKSATERENSILAMWHKIVNTLQECALQTVPSQDHDYEDLNVEHAQLLVYMFHSLTLMQKKSVVETLSISDRKKAMTLAPHQLMLTTRLMLLLEYLMRHLYDAPQSLLQQIKSRIYCEVPYIEQAYRRLSHDETSMRPKFYALTNSEINNQENPKFDGLACNFVLGTPHKLKYPLLLDALLALLNTACVCDNELNQASPVALSAAHYCFQTAWRLVISMPPATPHMDKLALGTGAALPSPLPLHAVVWAPRADNKKVVCAGKDLEALMEVPNNPSEQAVWIARLKVCSTFGPLGNAAGSTPPPAIGAWLRAHLPTNGFYTAHIIPSESAVLNLVSSHCELISANPKYSIGMSLMMLAYSAAKLLEIGATRLVDNTELMKKTIDLVLPALTDGRLEFIAEPLGGTLNVLIPQVNKAEQLIHEHIIRTTYPVMVENLQPSTEKTLRHMVKYWEKILERPPGRMAYESVFIDSTTYSLGKILLSAQNARPTYSERVIKLFIKIFNSCETADHLNSALCISICTFIGVADQQKLASFMNQICFGPP